MTPTRLRLLAFILGFIGGLLTRDGVIAVPVIVVSLAVMLYSLVLQERVDHSPVYRAWR